MVVNTFPVCNTGYVNHCLSYRSEGGANVPPTKESPLSTCLWFSEIVSLAQGLCHEAYVLTDRNIAYLGSCEEVGAWLPLLLSGNFLLPAPSEGDNRNFWSSKRVPQPPCFSLIPQKVHCNPMCMCECMYKYMSVSTCVCIYIFSIYSFMQSYIH